MSCRLIPAAPASVAFVLVLSLGVTTAQQAVFRSRTDSVLIDVSVRMGNTPAHGLAADDFDLFDNGVRQQIESLSVGAVPIDATLFIDTSGSTAGGFGQLESDVRRIATLLRPDDRLRLLVFDDQVRDVFGLQAPGGALRIEALTQGTVSSPVYDALILAMLRPTEPDRRQLVVAITDAQDNGSFTGSATVRAVAQRAEVVLHLVLVTGGASVGGAASPGRAALRSLPDRAGEQNLDEAAASTGGRLYRAPTVSTHDRVVDAFKTALDDYRQSYLIRFSPTGVSRGGWHTVEVRIPEHKELVIRAKKGYFGG
jgi:VWFA-related protein